MGRNFSKSLLDFLVPECFLGLKLSHKTYILFDAGKGSRIDLFFAQGQTFM